MAVVLVLAWVGFSARPRGEDGFRTYDFGQLPVLHEGRLKPIDTVARSSLLMMRSKQTIRTEKGRLSATRWFLDMAARPDVADDYKVFVIDDPDVLGLLGIRSDGRYYSMNALRAQLEEIDNQASRAEAIESARRSRFQRAILGLRERLVAYQRLENTLQVSGTDDFPAEIARYREVASAGIEALAAHEQGGGGGFDDPAVAEWAALVQQYRFLDDAAHFRALPPLRDEWQTVGFGLLECLDTGDLHPGVGSYAAMLHAWQTQDAAAFNRALDEYRGMLGAHIPAGVAKAGREARFNLLQPFSKGMIVYVMALLATFLSWMIWPAMLSRGAFYLLVLAFVVHTAGIAMRILLQGRPPVTNLYSSAVFVGWAAVGIGILLERLYRRGIGTATASAAGFATLIVAHHLSATGDTMEMMRAVLNSNFWLSTHVITITLGYSGAFLAGFLAHIFIFRGVFSRTQDPGSVRDMERMIYGVLCFTLLFSFVGTVLGGIWADQSWGRFWGWDPKENGALLIVLWTAMALHARAARYVGPRGLALLAIGGNIVTSFSWFGVNMLGIGLHSYGFMEGAFFALVLFMVSQLGVILMGSLPARYWRSSPLLLLVAVSLAATVPAIPTTVGAVESADCAMCHGGDDAAIPAVADSSLAASTHAGFSCIDCHTGIAELPHAEDLPVVTCGNCHGDEAEMYRGHGRGMVGETEDLPGCADCHGSHDIRPSSDPLSRVHPLHLPETCGRCHQDLDLAQKHRITVVKTVELYKGSVHGEATQGGVPLAATCIDCHSPAGTAHQILGPGDPTSSINHFNIPRTCGKCHNNVEQDYWAGIHGQLTARGETDTPVCTHCHGEHGILRVADPRSTVSPTQLAEATCAPCHEAAFLNEKYGIPAGRLASFVDSYHGMKSKAGDLTVANCASCHGTHRILPSNDPSSSIHPANLKDTCGRCHPGISTELALTPIHDVAIGRRPGWPRAVALLYLVGIVVIIGLMTVHVVMDYRRHTIETRRLPQVRRMGLGAVWQHALLAATFTVLALSGFALRYGDAWLFRMLFGWDGGSSARGIIHRVSAVLFVLVCLWHLFYLRTSEGRRFVRDLWPRARDFAAFAQTVIYHLGKRARPKHTGRFGYPEKAEYWALAWGSVVMIGTGFMLWFDNVAVRFLSKGVLEVMLVIHHYEAWLAVLAVAIWHFYWTIFNPGVYPGNPAWITGTMPRSWHTDGGEVARDAGSPVQVHDKPQGNDPPETSGSS